MPGSQLGCSELIIVSFPFGAFSTVYHSRNILLGMRARVRFVSRHPMAELRFAGSRQTNSEEGHCTTSLLAMNRKYRSESL